VKGKENWSWATKEIWDRLDGKAAVTVEAEEKEVCDVRELSDDELNAIIARGLAKGY
jgi:hypothetical protein